MHSARLAGALGAALMVAGCGADAAFENACKDELASTLLNPETLTIHDFRLLTAADLVAMSAELTDVTRDLVGRAKDTDCLAASGIKTDARCQTPAVETLRKSSEIYLACAPMEECAHFRFRAESSTGARITAFGLCGRSDDKIVAGRFEIPD